MQVDGSIFRNLISQAAFQSNGDAYEQRFSQVVCANFPACETLWKFLVVPLTQRIDNYPNYLGANLRFRQNVDADLEDLSTIHYSAFLNLAFAHWHLQQNSHCGIGDFYVHLGSTCDLVEAFLEKLYFLLLQVRGQQCSTLQQMSKAEFLQLTEAWYDNHYQGLYQYYLQRGKSPPINLPSRKNILKEFFDNYLSQSNLRKNYIKHSQMIREFRNVIVHDVKVADVVISGQRYIPKPSRVQQYRTWREVFAAVNDSQKIKQDFSLPNHQLQSDLIELERILDQIWKVMVAEFTKEFYSQSNKTLRDLFNIQFA